MAEDGAGAAAVAVVAALLERVRPPATAPIAAVLFDYGGTLADFSRPEASLQRAYERIRAQLLEAGHSAPPVDALLRDVHDRVEDECMRHAGSGSAEEIDIASSALAAYRDVGISLTTAELERLLLEEQQAWWDGVRPKPDALVALDELRRAGLRIGICSNAPFFGLHEQLRHFGFDRCVDGAAFSGRVGWRKPDQRMFAAALQAINAEAATTVMVGDSERDDVEGAQRSGMRAVLYRASDRSPAPTRADAVITALSELPQLLRAGAPILDAHG